MHCCAVVVNTSTEKPLKLCLYKNYCKKKKLICKVTVIFTFREKNLCDSLMINMALTETALS